MHNKMILFMIIFLFVLVLSNPSQALAKTEMSLLTCAIVGSSEPLEVVLEEETNAFGHDLEFAFIIGKKKQIAILGFFQLDAAKKMLLDQQLGRIKPPAPTGTWFEFEKISGFENSSLNSVMIWKSHEIFLVATSSRSGMGSRGFIRMEVERGKGTLVGAGMNFFEDGIYNLDNCKFDW